MTSDAVLYEMFRCSSLHCHPQSSAIYGQKVNIEALWSITRIWLFQKSNKLGLNHCFCQMSLWIVMPNAPQRGTLETHPVLLMWSIQSIRLRDLKSLIGLPSPMSINILSLLPPLSHSLSLCPKIPCFVEEGNVCPPVPWNVPFSVQLI